MKAKTPKAKKPAAAEKKPVRKAKQDLSSPVDSSAEFEKLLRNAAGIEHYSLRLYITGTTARSTQAVANIRALCDEYLPDRYDLEVVDIYQQPAQAADEQIIAAPTLIKKTPMPPKRLIGDLSDRDKVIVGLDLKGNTSGKGTRWTTA